MKEAMNLSSTLDALHGEVMTRGWVLFQPFRFGKDDTAHVDVLLALADFPQGARVLDVGCGIGECARLMKLARPDLDFVLVNFSEAQLHDCPTEFEQHMANAHALPFDDESFDAVMFNAALGNMDMMVALAEASRVLRADGVLFLNEVRRVAGDNDAMERILQFSAYNAHALLAFAESIGLHGEEVGRYLVYFEYLRQQWQDDAQYGEAFAGAEPGLVRLVKQAATPIAAKHGALFGRHEQVALQLSGGKDSLTLLHAMKPWWDRLTVYWTNPGNPFPETVVLMEAIRASVPNFKEVTGRQREIVAADGWPSDVVPVRWTTAGQFVFGEQPFKVQGRLDCCWRSLMEPMHQAMFDDGITCILRGKRLEEADKSPSRSGDVIDGIELVYPLWNWAGSQVVDYMEAHDIPLPASYLHAGHSLDCMDCTAWNGEGISRYLKAAHPEQFTEYVRRIGLIKSAIVSELDQFEV